MAKRKLKKTAKRFFRVIFLILFIFIACEIGSYYIILGKNIKPIEIHENNYYSASDFWLILITDSYDYESRIVSLNK